MPFLLPRSPEDRGPGAFVLAFGSLSMLELLATLGGKLSNPESPTERIGVFDMLPGSASSVAGLAGIHKFATLLTPVRTDGSGIDDFTEKITGRVEISNFSVSGYGLAAEDHEGLVQLMLDAFRTKRLRKLHLLRPKDNELRGDQVVARGSADVVAFPYHDAYCLALTTYVPDASEFRYRGVGKPAPHSDISLSPRLASTLVNLSGVERGQTLLDPFCGSGTILAEGLQKGTDCVGIDSSRRLVDEARLNLRWASRTAHGGHFRLETGDARALGELMGGRTVDGVATEPILLPRLKSRLSLDVAKEMIDQAGDVYAEALASLSEVVRPGGRIVVVVPVLETTEGNQIYVGLDGRPLGLSLFQPGQMRFQYPIRLSFESTRWIKRAVYVFEVRP
ncbi:MAG TPA: DNA methyltransferase [Nitrososphaerales archaeon]|nr:DNA methyltransferase [Nitrososphaerales archaeon]